MLMTAMALLLIVTVVLVMVIVAVVDLYERMRVQEARLAQARLAVLALAEDVELTAQGKPYLNTTREIAELLDPRA
jgi:hypothetical protein